MKTFCRIILLLVAVPAFSYAQDTVRLKKQAAKVADAMIKGDYVTIVNHTYPKVIAAMGGKDKMLKMIQDGTLQMQESGFTFQSASVGSPGKFYKAGTEIHCLMPETVVLTSQQGRLVNHSYLLAITKNGGVTWYFLDINRGTYKLIPKLFPNFNKNLVIPEPTQPGMQ